MKKKTVYPRCPATISGKHKWIEYLHDGFPFNDGASCIPLEHPQCQYCEITDDTVILKHEEQEGRVAYS